MKNDAILFHGSKTPSIPSSLRNLTNMINNLNADEDRPLTQDNFRLVYFGFAFGYALALISFAVELRALKSSKNVVYKDPPQIRSWGTQDDSVMTRVAFT